MKAIDMIWAIDDDDDDDDGFIIFIFSILNHDKLISLNVNATAAATFQVSNFPSCYGI